MGIASPAGAPATPAAPLPGQDNGVSVTATNVAIGLVRRERGDALHLVTVVATEAQQREGHELMARLLKQFKSYLDVATHVLVRADGEEKGQMGQGSMGWAALAWPGLEL